MTREAGRNSSQLVSYCSSVSDRLRKQILCNDIPKYIYLISACGYNGIVTLPVQVRYVHVSQNSATELLSILSQLYRWVNWGTERQNYLLVNSRWMAELKIDASPMCGSLKCASSLLHTRIEHVFHWEDLWDLWGLLMGYVIYQDFLSVRPFYHWHHWK